MAFLRRSAACFAPVSCLFRIGLDPRLHAVINEPHGACVPLLLLAAGGVKPVAPQSELFAAAEAARGRAYAPYSGFTVGAAILAEDGRIHAGANVENAAYPMGQCAEASAIGAMVAAGARRIMEMAVAGGGAELCTPCGGCRQRIREFAAPEAVIHILGPEGLRRSIAFADLLPLSFGPATIERANAKE
jgi:cytidine deaminase